MTPRDAAEAAPTPAAPTTPTDDEIVANLRTVFPKAVARIEAEVRHLFAVEQAYDPATMHADFMAEAAARSTPAEALICEGECGDLAWTVERYGYPTHKHGCPRRNRCQSHPDGCSTPAEALDPELIERLLLNSLDITPTTPDNHDREVGHIRGSARYLAVRLSPHNREAGE